MYKCIYVYVHMYIYICVYIYTFPFFLSNLPITTDIKRDTIYRHYAHSSYLPVS